MNTFFEWIGHGYLQVNTALGYFVLATTIVYPLVAGTAYLVWHILTKEDADDRWNIILALLVVVWVVYSLAGPWDSGCGYDSSQTYRCIYD